MSSSNFRDKTVFSDDPAHAYATAHSLRLHPSQEKLIEVTLNHPRSGMLGSADEIQLLQNIVKSINARKTLDIGVFTGYSAMSIALALPNDGKVVACDVNDEFASIGKPIWKEAGVDHKIDLIIAPAAQTLETLLTKGEAETFDFAFIDADKQNYDVYYELCLKLIRKNGIIAFDNMFWGGQVYNPNVNDPDTVALRTLAKKLHSDDRVNVSFVVIGDGTVLVFKK